MRVTDDFLNTIDRWRAKQGDEPARAEAIRRLVEIGLLNRPTTARPVHKQKLPRAAKLAGEAIDMCSDREVRKRKLIKGPLRDPRKDRAGKWSFRLCRKRAPICVTRGVARPENI
jgi:hypothetical protein